MFTSVARPPTDSGYLSHSTGHQISEQSLLSEQAVDAMLRYRNMGIFVILIRIKINLILDVFF